MSKHGEPWKLSYPQIMANGIGIADFKNRDIHANSARAVLCVNACEGMSEDEVKRLPVIAKEWDAVVHSGSHECPAMIDRLQNNINALRKELEEADKLLKRANKWVIERLQDDVIHDDIDLPITLFEYAQNLNKDGE